MEVRAGKCGALFFPIRRRIKKGQKIQGLILIKKRKQWERFEERCLLLFQAPEPAQPSGEENVLKVSVGKAKKCNPLRNRYFLVNISIYCSQKKNALLVQHDSAILFYKHISRTSAVSSTNFGSILIFASCVVGTCNILCGRVFS